MADQVFGRRWSIWMADTVMKKFPNLRNRWAYDYGVLCKGLEQVYRQSGEDKYFRYIQENMDYFVDEDGAIRYYRKEDHNLDFINNGKTLLFLYAKTGNEKYKKAVDLLRSQLAEHPRTEEGGFWHKDCYPHQMWLDGLYMAQPFYAQYIEMFDPRQDFQDVLLQFRLIEKHLKNPESHLLYHGWDERKKSFWADPETGRSANYWGRSVGWYACALVDTLDYLHADEDKKLLVEAVQDLAQGIAAVQDEQSGLWYQVLDQHGRYGNYTEASCSCMFAYFLLKAAEKGYIAPSYALLGQRAFRGILREFVEVDQNGLLDLKGTVYVSGLGGSPERDGSYEYYISEPRQVNNLLGIGAFLMAASQLEKSLA